MSLRSLPLPRNDNAAMRITAKQFALSLYESVEARTAAQVKVAVKRFVELLVKKNSLAAADKVIKEFIRIWNERRGLVEAEITSANELSQETVKLLKVYVARQSGAKEVKVNGKIDKDILGGVIIRYGDKIFDGSLKTQLAELKEKMVK